MRQGGKSSLYKGHNLASSSVDDWSSPQLGNSEPAYNVCLRVLPPGRGERSSHIYTRLQGIETSGWPYIHRVACGGDRQPALISQVLEVEGKAGMHGNRCVLR